MEIFHSRPATARRRLAWGTCTKSLEPFLFHDPASRYCDLPARSNDGRRPKLPTPICLKLGVQAIGYCSSIKISEIGSAARVGRMATRSLIPPFRLPLCLYDEKLDFVPFSLHKTKSCPLPGHTSYRGAPGPITPSPQPTRRQGGPFRYTPLAALSYNM